MQLYQAFLVLVSWLSVWLVPRQSHFCAAGVTRCSQGILQGRVVLRELLWGFTVEKERHTFVGVCGKLYAWGCFRGSQ